jgi:glycosidase
MQQHNDHIVDRSRFHRNTPDYSGPPFNPTPECETRLKERLACLYGEAAVAPVWQELLRLMRVYLAFKSPTMQQWETTLETGDRFSERDAILITYGDLIRSPAERPLLSLAELSSRYLKGVFNTLHILPFFPYSSDRGFAVIDFKEVDPALGTWDDILALKEHFNLMFDGVFNHVSSQSRWFQEFLNQNPDYADFFTVFGQDDPVCPEALARLFRPRTSEVLSEYQTLNGPMRVWTTFSPDQVDLKFQNPLVLLRMIDVLLFYVRKGADLIRLDAVTYLWDELGGTGVHLSQTHEIIKLFRDVLDAVAPHVMIITETNVPHRDNVSYFGNGTDEAQMVYNFALPPLVLHTFQTADVTRINEWATGLTAPGPHTTFLNFLDSHDGIGVLGARGILTDAEIAAMVRCVEEHDGLISYKRESDGSETPYELNITSYSAINHEDAGPVELRIQRYLAARAIALVLPGIPGVYLHGLLGSRNDVKSVLAGGEKRDINRRNLDKGELFAVLDDATSVTSRIASRISHMIRVRSTLAAFHPAAPHRVLRTRPDVFVVERVSPDGASRILCMTDVSDQAVRVELSDPAWSTGRYTNILAEGTPPRGNPEGGHELPPYGIEWWVPISGSCKKSEVCRDYPKSHAHAIETGCPGFADKLRRDRPGSETDSGER